MNLFSKKTAVPQRSTPSQKPTGKPVQSGNSVKASQTSNAGITVDQTKGMRLLQTNAQAAAEQSATAVGMLQDMMEPSQGENGQLDEVKQLLTDIVTKLAAMDARLSSIEQRLPVLRVVWER